MWLISLFVICQNNYASRIISDGNSHAESKILEKLAYLCVPVSSSTGTRRNSTLILETRVSGCLTQHMAGLGLQSAGINGSLKLRVAWLCKELRWTPVTWLRSSYFKTLPCNFYQKVLPPANLACSQTQNGLKHGHWLRCLISFLYCFSSWSLSARSKATRHLTSNTCSHTFMPTQLLSFFCQERAVSATPRPLEHTPCITSFIFFCIYKPIGDCNWHWQWAKINLWNIKLRGQSSARLMRVFQLIPWGQQNTELVSWASWQEMCSTFCKELQILFLSKGCQDGGLMVQLLFYPTAIGSEPQDPTLDSWAHWTRVMCGHSGANLACLTFPAFPNPTQDTILQEMHKL